MSQAQQRTYKRSWKNLLINKSYQLRMTLVLVIISGGLMAGLGTWVMSQARTATEVAINNVEGTRCEKPAWMEEEPSRVVVDEITPMKGAAPAAVPDSQPEPVADPAPVPVAPTADDADADADAEDGERTRPRITITNSEMEITKPAGDVGSEASAALAEVDEAERKEQELRFHTCESGKKERIADLRAGETLILRVLIGLGLLLVIGLAAYGIKMTHKVAGPLFKVSLYLRKLHDGKYDTVYNLRKGDHLVDFYEHFKLAHDGVKGMQQEDIRQLKAIIAAADEAGIADQSPELAAALEALRKDLADKEASIV